MYGASETVGGDESITDELNGEVGGIGGRIRVQWGSSWSQTTVTSDQGLNAACTDARNNAAIAAQSGYASCRDEVNKGASAAGLGMNLCK
jgi:hypothetical protein